jgi:hypothetical protein
VDEIKVIHSNGVLFVGGADLRRILGAANIQSTYFTVEGQAAPDVPGGGQAPTSAPVCIISGGEEIGPSTHPSTLVAVAQVCDIATCTVISAEGVTRLTRMVVLGGDGSTNRLSGQVWVAEPSRAGDIAGSRQKPGIFTLGGSGLLDPEGTLVEDPGGTVGAPSGGSFVFVGQGCGHGVGMSQHGAKILAESGWTSEQILKYFYTGIEIKRSW